MAAYNDYVLVRRVGFLDLRDEARGADYVEGSYAEEALWVVDVFGFEDFGDYGDGGVNLVAVSFLTVAFVDWRLTGLEMISMLAFGAESAAAFARSRTIEALVLKRSAIHQCLFSCVIIMRFIPSRVMPGLRGTPAGIRTISAPSRAFLRPLGVGS